MKISVSSHRTNKQENCNLDPDLSNSKAQWCFPNTRSSPRSAVFVCALPGHFRQVQLFETQWSVVPQAPLSMGFSRQVDWSGLPCPPLLYVVGGSSEGGLHFQASAFLLPEL